MVKSTNQVLQGVKQMVNHKGEWVGNSLPAVLVDTCPGISKDVISRCLRTLESLKVISRTKVPRNAGFIAGRGIGVKLKLLRPDVTIVKEKGYFKAIER